MRYSLIIGLLVYLSQFFGVAQSSAQLACQKSPLAVADEGLKYKLRGNRCEGLFMQPVAASSHIRVIGYHLHAPVFEPGSKTPIRVSVGGSAASQAIQLHAVSMRFRQYYRMDTMLQSSHLFLWDRTLLNNQQIALRPDELAMVACDGACDKAAPRLLPVSLVADEPPPHPAPELIFSSNVDISKLVVRLVRLPGGKPMEEEVLRGRVLLALSPEHFPLGRSWQAGTYDVTVTAIPRHAEAAVDVTNAEILVP